MIKNLLLIDDDTIYSFIFPELIRDSGLVGAFHIENDGLSGLNYLESCGENFPDLILVDLKMPVLDGFGFLAEYGPRFSEKHPRTVVMVMTSSVRQRDRNEVLQHPFVSDILSKPITTSLLGQIIEQHFLAS
jgi:CheY-like chemotaxis protein